MSEKEEAFWIVWSPTGASPPRKRHPSEFVAHEEAKRLATAAPGAVFYVLKAQKLVKSIATITADLPDPEIPF